MSIEITSRRRFWILCSILIFGIGIQTLMAQKIKEKIILGHTILFKSEILKEERDIIIYLPNAYHG